ncbi:MAG: MFS transporter, partial [Cyanothece sp. SIO2G6]|nr:MFS transporter [Cyanothece sp. SIO2G6]
HLYGAVAIYGCFGQIQTLAYSTSIALLVPKTQYTRAESMVAAVNYSAAIFSPVLAGSLYPIIGLSGVFAIDLVTFLLAFGTLLMVKIPQSTERVTQSNQQSHAISLRQTLTYGFRYIADRPGLVAMVIAFSCFAIPNDISKALYNPMILARSGGDAQILGMVTTAAGIGGVLGAIGLSAWGGFHKKIHGMLVGFAITGFFKIILGVGQASWIWIAMHFCATLAVPLFYSSSNAIWYSKVPPSSQGRVLAADQMIGLVVGAIAPLIAGPLADYVFEPAMAADGWLAPIFGPVIGTGPGAGIAVLYAMMACLMMLVGLGGYGIHTLRNVEAILPDHDDERSTAPH